MQRIGTGVAVAALVVLTFGNVLWAAPPADTTISVPDMHCMGCAKKMAAKLYEVPGVATVKADVEKTTIIISPKPQQASSPKLLWEAVEKAGYKPAKLEGPSGRFTEKPKS